MKKEQEKTPTVGRTLRYYIPEMLRHKRWFLPLFILMPAATLLGTYIGPLIISDVINRITTETFTPEELLPAFGWSIAAFIGIRILTEIVLWRYASYSQWRLEANVVYALNQKCFDTLAEQSMHFHNNRFGGSLVSQVGRFTSGYVQFSDTFFWNIVPLITALISIFVILGPKLPTFTIILFVLAIIFSAVAWFSFKKNRAIHEKESEAKNKLSGRLADAITNILAVKSYGHEGYERKRFNKSNAEAQSALVEVIRSHTKRSVGFGAVLVALNSVFIVILVFGEPWFNAPVGTLVLAMMYGQALVGELWGVNNILRGMNRAFGDAREMVLTLDEPVIVADKPGAKKLQVAAGGGMDFSDISFTHIDGKETVFEDFTLKIKPGERVGLVGRSGSGKTTLTKLLLRFADVNSGQVLVDGQDIAAVTQDSLHKNIAYVPQETLLFHRTIRENIAYGKLSATEEEVIKAAKLANAWEFIQDLPDGLDTLTGERGVKLSGGQRQRIAIARAILKDAPILVLDEATSALDSESEKLIQDALKKLMKGRTSIVIAHRLSTVSVLDRIVVLKDGKIVEDGPHDELVKGDKEYTKLWNRQTGAFSDND